jgi:hypothetical protein
LIYKRINLFLCPQPLLQIEPFRATGVVEGLSTPLSPPLAAIFPWIWRVAEVDEQCSRAVTVIGWPARTQTADQGG